MPRSNTAAASFISWIPNPFVQDDSVHASGEIPMSGPLVSVLLTTAGHPRSVSGARDRAAMLCQTYRDFELLIVDDGSTDTTVEIARAYERLDPRVRVVVNDRNLGQFRNRNRAAELARAPLLRNTTIRTT